MTTNQTIDGVPRRVCHFCVTLARNAYCPVCDDEPAAQPQGEPVLYVAQDSIDDPECDGMHATRYPNELQCVPLYAEQPAPVAVDAVIHGSKLDEYDAVLDALDPESVCPYLSNGEVAELVAAVRTLQVRQITQPAPVAVK